MLGVQKAARVSDEDHALLVNQQRKRHNCHPSTELCMTVLVTALQCHQDSCKVHNLCQPGQPVSTIWSWKVK
jgi:hypothetical protein